MDRQPKHSLAYTQKRITQLQKALRKAKKQLKNKGKGK